MRCFVHDEKTGAWIDHEHPRPVDLRDALAIFRRLEFDPDTYFGLVNDDGAVLQFIGDRDGRSIVADLPIPLERGSFQLRTVQETGGELIRGFYAGKNLVEIHRFEFFKW